MSKYYRKWQAAMLLDEQVGKVFGDESPEADRTMAIRSYWCDRHFEAGCPIRAPSAEVLLERIKEEERAIKKDKSKSCGR